MAEDVGITIGVKAAPMRAKTAEMRSRLIDLKPVMEGRAVAFQTMTKRDVFGREQSPLGEAWDALADSTVARRRKKSKKILTDTGALQNAITSTADSKGIRVGVSGAPATYGTTHQFGHTFNRMSSKGKAFQQTVPRRPFLPLNEAGIVVATSGPMKTWADRTKSRVKKFVLTGQL